MPSSGKQSAGSIPTQATPSIPNTHWEGAPEAGKCKALAPQSGDPVPAPRLLWAVVPQAPPLPQQSWCSPSRSPALEENWEQEEAAEKCHHYKKLPCFLPEHEPTESRECLPDAASAQTNTSGCAGNAQPRLLRCSFTPRALQTWLLHGKQAKSCNPWEGPARRPDG